MYRSKNVLPVLSGSLLLLVFGCVGDPPTSNQPPAGADAGDPVVDDDPDAGPEEPAAILVSGLVRDYQEAMAGEPGALQNSAVNTEGLTPALSVTSATDGAFALEDLPAGSVFYAGVTVPEPLQYRPTRSAMITVAEESVQADLYAVSETFALINYTGALGGAATPAPATAIVIVNMYRNNGAPLTGVPLADVTLTDALGAPVPGALGPYFFGLTGNMDAEVLTSIEAPTGLARVGFLDVPPGSYQVNVTYLNGLGEPTALPPVSITTVAGGATLAATSSASNGGGGGGGGGGNLNFVNDIYPDLQRASQGGLSCAVCHTAGGLMGDLPYDAPAAEVYAAIIARPGLINVAAPEQSGLLVNPLYETPPDHPNATFANVNNPYYIKWMTWISQGALEGSATP